MWRLRPIDNKNEFKKFVSVTKLKEDFCRILWARNIRNEKEAFEFLNPRINYLPPSSLLPDFEPAFLRLKEALEKGERILIWGHEDLDGFSSTALLLEILRDLRGDVRYFIPQKHKSKYGLDIEELRGRENEGVRLVIMVDSGTTNVSEIKEAKELGFDVIVLDHHEVVNELPPAIAVVNPKRPDSSYPFRELAGVGVVFKFILGLTKRLIDIDITELISCKPETMFYVAAGTLSDRVPLRKENRILLSLFLKNFDTGRKALKEIVSNVLGGRKLTVGNFLSLLLPIFANARSAEGVEFLLSESIEESSGILQNLSLKLKKWQEDAKLSLEIAEEKKVMTESIVIVSDERISLQTLGYVAGKLQEKYRRPAIAIGKINGCWIGECRSPEKLDLLELLKLNKDHFVNYGGHKRACGFTIRDENLTLFINKAKELADSLFLPKLSKEEKTNYYEAEISLEAPEWHKEMELLPPFGEGNPAPILLSKKNEVAFDSEGNLFLVKTGMKTLKDESNKLASPGVYDLIYTIDDELNIIIKDVL